MKGVFSAPGDYVYFKSQVPLHKIPGYRVISVDIPRVWNHHEWVQAFEKFLDVIDVHHIHLYGTSLGGFLAQLFAQHRPRRVRSLILSNTFLDTRSFAAAMPWAPVYVCQLDPCIFAEKYVLTGIRDGPHEPFIADSVDFVVSQVETLSREDLASRLTLNVDAASVGSLLLSDSYITIMDTNDYCAIPQQLKDQLSERYPEARRAYLKTGGDFPFLSRPDEVNLHLQVYALSINYALLLIVYLPNAATPATSWVEARPDLVRGIPKDGTGGSHSEKEKKKEDPDDQPKDGGSSESRSGENQLPPASEISESHAEEKRLFSNAKGHLVKRRKNEANKAYGVPNRPEYNPS
ncbi:hypothetical protein GH714_009439 [Hevea brasiliensis]|uniref:Maspardin n=1 Tax=Hevea brasiliensis TaxID=3981 RepID=A0A6A6MLS6_HEVBR|nr:hypothetical protein GH714_009439 [Hevea brasiliensis]